MAILGGGQAALMFAFFAAPFTLGGMSMTVEVFSALFGKKI